MTISPLQFFSHLKWIDDRPLLNVIEPYRQRIFTETLHTFGEDGRPHYNLALTGRGKKNSKSADLILAALYRFLAWESRQGNDCFSFWRMMKARLATISSSSRRLSP